MEIEGNVVDIISKFLMSLSFYDGCLIEEGSVLEILRRLVLSLILPFTRSL